MSALKVLERRKASILERWYFARTKAEATPLVHVGFTVSLPSPMTAEEIKARLGEALRRLPKLHPFLNSRAFNYDSPAPEMILVEDNPSPEELLTVVTGTDFLHALDEHVMTVIELDGTLWGAWLYLPEDERSQDGRFLEAYVSVYIHHSIADGIAVCGVARTLVLLLNNPALDIVLPQTGLPITLDSAVSLRPSVYDFASTIFSSLISPRLPKVITALYEPKTTAWTGCADASPPPRKCLHRIVQIPPAMLRRLLAFGRAHGLTFTVILHTLLWIAASPLAGENQHLFSSTPASVISLVSKATPAPVGGCYISPLQYTDAPAARPGTIRDFVALGQPYKALLKDPAAIRKGLSLWGIIGLVSYDFLVSFIRTRYMTGEGRNSIAISNLRNVHFTQEDVKGGWKPRRGLFTQPMLGASATFLTDAISVSVEGEPDWGDGTTLVFCWEDGVLTQEMADGIMERTREGWEWLLDLADEEASDA